VTSRPSRAWVHSACRGVHGATVALEADHLAVGGGDGRARRERETLADGPPHELQPVVGRCGAGQVQHAEAAGDALVGGDGVLRQQSRDRAMDRLGRELPLRGFTITPILGH
jgi:hypothetical protein